MEEDCKHIKIIVVNNKHYIFMTFVTCARANNGQRSFTVMDADYIITILDNPKDRFIDV